MCPKTCSMRAHIAFIVVTQLSIIIRTTATDDVVGFFVVFQFLVVLNWKQLTQLMTSLSTHLGNQ
jgi:hypothetical protein